MASTSETDWNIGQRSGLVSVGTHNLFLSVSGPDRQHGNPVVLLITGVTSTLAEWPVAIRMISATHRHRIVAYDRAGFGQSEESPNTPSPTNIVAELTALLKAARIEPPFVTLGHSWGGILSMEFYVSRPDDVVGMIFIDAVAPSASYQDQTPWKNPVVLAMCNGLDYRELTGLRKNTPFSPAEYQAYMDEEDSAKHQRQGIKEHYELDRSYAALAAKKLFHKDPALLGNKPVCVVYAHSARDFQKLFDAAVERGNGTDEERATFRYMVEIWEKRERETQQQYLSLSTITRWTESSWCGHNVQLMEPEVIADAVTWTTEKVS